MQSSVKGIPSFDLENKQGKGVGVKMEGHAADDFCLHSPAGFLLKRARGVLVRSGVLGCGHTGACLVWVCASGGVLVACPRG